MIAICDVDGVLANFALAACLVHNKSYLYDDPTYLGQGDMGKLLGIPPKEFYTPMNEQFWATLPKLHHADAIIKLLETFFDVYLVTKPVRTHGCLEGKRIWIEHHYPQYHGRWFIGKPKHICATKDSILFDDYGKNIDDFIEVGGRGFLMPAPWNYKHNENPLDAIEYYVTQELS